MTDRRSGISVLIATPHSISRELLLAALKRQGQFHVAASATSSQEALDATKGTELDVALISATLADGPLSGFGALRQIRECAPEVKSVILVDSLEHNLVVDAFRAGAKGVFCLSLSTFKLLCKCVEQVHAGQIWANSSELCEVMEAFSPTCTHAGSKLVRHAVADQTGRRCRAALGRGHAKSAISPGNSS